MATLPAVLIVDDHAETRALLCSVLGLSGFEVVGQVGSVRGAQQWLARHDEAPALVLCDVDLGPGPDGLVLTRWLAARHPEVRVVVLSGADAERTARAAEAAGAHDFVPKSAPVGTLLKALEAATASASGLAGRHAGSSSGS